MITPATRTTVSVLSIVAALGATLALGACAPGMSSARRAAAVVEPATDPTIAFENEAEVYVDVYVVTDRREWRLGRVGPGARERLRIPDAAFAATSGFVRLAVIAGEPPTVQAALDPRASFTVAQPASELVLQRFSFWQRQLGGPQLVALRAEVGRP